MDPREHEILVVDDEPLILEYLKKIIEYHGHRAICRNSVGEGISALSGLEDRLSFIISDLFMPYEGRDDGGKDLLRFRNKACPHIPFYSMSGYSKEESFNDVMEMFKLHIDSFMQKPVPADKVKALIDNLTYNEIPAERIPVLIKTGGSSDDYDIYTAQQDIWNKREPSLKTKNYLWLLQFAVDLQKTGRYNVYITTGNGQIGQYYKTKYWKYRGDDTNIAAGHPHRMARGLEEMTRLITDFMNNSSQTNAVYVTPELLTGQSYNTGFPGIKDVFDVDIKSIFNQDKVIVIGSAPWPATILYDGSKHMAIPRYESDGQALVWASLFRTNLNMVKRASSLACFDILKGGYHIDGEEGLRRWKRIQSSNRILDRVSIDEFVEGVAEDGTIISTIGGDDNEPGHFLEKTAGEVMKALKVPLINYCHIAPYEEYKYHNMHIITGRPKPDIREKDYMKIRILQMIHGTDRSQIYNPDAAQKSYDIDDDVLKQLGLYSYRSIFKEG